jgi:hypothetical protein
MLARLASPQAVSELLQALGEEPFQRQDLIDGHP